MNEAVIISACRTPMGKFQGALSSLTAPELGAIAIEAALERANLKGDQVEEIIMGNVLPAGVGQAPARQAAIKAGIPGRAGALTINKMCGSGLKAVMLAAQAVRAGDADVVVAGGMESMSLAPYLVARNDIPMGNRTMLDSMMYDGLQSTFSGRLMGAIAEHVATEDKISREAQDQFSVNSHLKAAAAIEANAFDAEIVPVTIESRKGSTTITQDEGPRADSTMEKLGRLKAIFAKEGTVTAANASMVSDGAAAVVVTSAKYAEEHGLKPLARILSSATSGLEPDDLFWAPVPAVEMALEKANLTKDEIDIYELNEAFASQMIACQTRLGIPDEKINPQGGAIALGHPLGASGARTLVTLVHGLKSQQKKLGVTSLCLGGGNAVAMAVEAVE